MSKQNELPPLAYLPYGPPQAGRYIAEMATILAALARGAELPFLGYLLDMAAEEAKLAAGVPYRDPDPG